MKKKDLSSQKYKSFSIRFLFGTGGKYPHCMISWLYLYFVLIHNTILKLDEFVLSKKKKNWWISKTFELFPSFCLTNVVFLCFFNHYPSLHVLTNVMQRTLTFIIIYKGCFLNIYFIRFYYFFKIKFKMRSYFILSYKPRQRFTSFQINKRC